MACNDIRWFGVAVVSKLALISLIQPLMFWGILYLMVPESERFSRCYSIGLAAGAGFGLVRCLDSQRAGVLA